MKATSKRLIALVAGGLGLRAILRRRARSSWDASPADELKAKLATTKQPEPPQPATRAPAPVSPAEPEPPAQPTQDTAAAAVPDSAESVDERRADTHARARHAIEELRENRD